MTDGKLKIVSWNINGYRAVMKKGFLEIFQKINADIFILQEIKMQQNQLTQVMKDIPGYTSSFVFSTVKKGYSGVAIYTKIVPKKITKGIGLDYFDSEGRILQLDFDNFILFGVYFPNGQMSEERLAYKLDFYESFFNYVNGYRRQNKSVVIIGDFNTAHNDIDLKNPKANSNRSGFLSVERKLIDKIIDYGYVDTFRFFYPNVTKYSWWSYRFGSREKDIGWRIDYCFVSQDIVENNRLIDVFIYSDIYGSDHCPVGIKLKT